jgi:hypothetical protein
MRVTAEDRQQARAMRNDQDRELRDLITMSWSRPRSCMR